jgi:hypothetical protein
MEFLAQPSLGPDAEAVADEQHPDHQLGISRRPTRLAVEECQMSAQLTKVYKTID